MEFLACGVYCKKCDYVCPIRYLKSGKVFDCQQALPKEKRPLVFVCRVCGSLSEHSAQDIHKVKIQRPDQDQGLPATTIYRMTFQCAQESCGLPIEIYTEARVNEPSAQGRDEIQKWVLRLGLKRSCQKGHQATLLNAQSFGTMFSVA